MENNRYAIVTGASRGIGKAIAAALAEKGWNLVLTCRNSVSELQDFGDLLTSERGLTVLVKACDMGNSAMVTTLFQELKSKGIVPSLLINNAGIAHIGLLQDMTDAEWNEIIRTNLSSVFYTSRAVIPIFLQSLCSDSYTSDNDSASNNTDNNDVTNMTSSVPCPGRIINISSVWGIAGASCEVAYSATKGGVNAFTKALAKELAPSGIPVNAIACGCVDTEMNGHLSEAEKDQLADEIPAGRFVSPEEVAAAVLQLIDMPAYLTGQIITMDGGWL